MRAAFRLLGPAVLALVAVSAPRVAGAAFDLAAVPPTDPAVIHGTLPNGMRYYVRRNPKPEKHVELRLAVKVGSVQETEEERGLAHFNEHMNFNGTKSFAPGEIVSYLESIGARFGADSNAYTSYDETVYMLTVPTEKEGTLDKALTIMADWSGAATLSAEEIDKERGVVLDELRGGKGARKRIREKQDQVLFKGSRYADRSTIGLESVIKGAKAEVLRGFYRAWYKPELMAIIAVGDFDAADMERRLKERFGAIPAGDSRRDVPIWPVPQHDETIYSVESDKELTGNGVQIYYKRPSEPSRTVGDFRRDMVRQVATALLSLRLNERSLQPDPPFISAGAGTFRYVNPLEVFTVSASAKDGEIPKATMALMEEFERAHQHGFVADELDRVKTVILAYGENRLKEAPERRSGARVGEIVSSFLEDSPLTSDQWDFDATKALLPGITLAEVAASLREMSDGRSRVVLVQVPRKDGVHVPTVEEVKAIVEPAEARQVAAYVDDLAGKALTDEVPAGGKVVSTASIPEIGFDVLTLSNGVRVLWKKTDFRADQVLMTGFAQGGAADLGRAAFVPALRGDTYALESGLADFTASQLQKWLTGSGKIATASPSVSRFTRSLGGNCRPADFELMVQLAWLYFTKPAFRPDAFQRMIDDEVQSLRNQLNSPGGVYGRTVGEVASDGHWLFDTPTIGEIRALKPADVERSYREMFNDASEWTFVMVGNIDPAVHVPLVERWLGSLPTKSDTPRTTDSDKRYAKLGLRFPKGRISREVRKGIEDQSRTILMIDAPYRLDPQAAFDIDAVADLLDIRLRDKLREEKGETYGASVGLSSYSPYRDYGRINISFTGSPDARAGMVADVKDAIRWMKMTVPSAADVQKLREMRFNHLDVAEKENGYWLRGVASALLQGRDPRSVMDGRRRIEKLDARGVHAAARRWLDLNALVEVYLVPETWQPPAKSAAPRGEAPAVAPLGG